MSEILGVTRLGRDDEGPVDLLLAGGLIAEIRPSAAPPARRRLALPALVNAHDHCRPLSPTSFGAAGRPSNSGCCGWRRCPPSIPISARWRP